VQASRARRSPASPGRTRCLAAALTLCGVVPLLAACASETAKREAAAYGPTESVLEVLAVLRRHVPDDTYRFPPGRDYTGRNVYRASLLRLENLERVHADSLRSGHLDDVIAFGKARALERLGAYELAAQHYEQVVEHEGRLRDEAERSGRVCRWLAEATALGPRPADERDEGDGGSGSAIADPEVVIGSLDERVAFLERILRDERADLSGPDGEEDHYGAIVRQEIERADVTRARWFVERRHVLEGGTVRAVAELQRVIARHRPSYRYLRHVLALADLYAELAEEYVVEAPPESLRFDPPRFEELVDAATRLYQVVASQDGTPEKLVAARRLESFIAFTLQVDNDRFTR